MDDFREEVRAICEKVYDGASSEALWSEKGPGGEYKRDPELEMTPDEATAAIMSAFKRVPGVVVSPLVWREHSGPAWVAATPFGQYAIGKLVAGGFTAQCSGSHSVGDFDTIEAAKSACQVDYANREASALVLTEAPAQLSQDALVPGVVSDAMVEAAAQSLMSRWQTGSGLDDLPQDVREAVLNDARAALTAALSTSWSEEAREVPPYIRERADAEIAEIKASIGRDEPTVTVEIHGGGVAGVDESIAPLVKLLNDGGIKTVASCSGHGQRPGSIALADGRELIIARNWNEARLIDGLFSGINGEPAKSVEGALEFIRQSNEEIKGDFERVLLDAITVSEFGDRAAAIRERIREVRRSLTNGGK